jgi:Leucine-rich repeat (LRR) protein/predicted Ser/Thr protein kinase
MPFPSVKLEDLSISLPTLQFLKDLKLPNLPSVDSLKNINYPSLSSMDMTYLKDLKNIKLPLLSLPELRSALSTEEGKKAATVALGVAASGTFLLLIRRAEHNLPDVEIVSLEDFQQLHAGGLLRDFGAWIITPTATAVKVTGHGDRIPTFPRGICNLIRLKELNVSGNALTELPSGVSRLTALTNLDVSLNRLTTLPDGIGNLKALVALNAMGNKLESLPDGLGGLASLRRLGLKGNELKTLPASIGNLKLLKELFLTDNLLESIPEEIGGCEALVKLQASHNSLRSLPASLGSLPHLELLRVACCEIVEIPQAVTASSSLAWLSLATNPTCKPSPRPSRWSGTVKLKDVAIGMKLGDGASGEVFSATWKNRQVALKLFRGDRSPDGHSDDEIGIACALSDKHLIKVLARIAEPLGIIMEYVDGKPMAEKPNSESLLRCRWEQGVSFSLEFVLNVASGLASALEAMHSKGVIHGDVYAHNVLADAEGKVVLCDYGAAFYCPRAAALAYEGHECRAFGLLLRDLLTRMDIGFEGMEAALDVQKQLLLMVQQCTTGLPAERPRMSIISRRLTSLKKQAASRGATPRSDRSRISGRSINGSV